LNALADPSSLTFLQSAHKMLERLLGFFRFL